jgi:hypothetical protein
MITETELVHLALRIDLLMIKNNLKQNENEVNELLADWLINNQIQII